MIIHIILSIIGYFIFGASDSLFFLFAENSLVRLLKQFKRLDKTTLGILSNGVAGAFSILIASHIRKFIKSHFDVIDSPYIDAIGIFSGSLFVAVLYIFYTKYYSYFYVLLLFSFILFYITLQESKKIKK